MSNCKQIDREKNPFCYGVCFSNTPLKQNKIIYTPMVIRETVDSDMNTLKSSLYLHISIPKSLIVSSTKTSSLKREDLFN